MKDLKFDINEFFDKAKIEENEFDRKRIKENCEFLKSKDIEVLENMLLDIDMSFYCRICLHLSFYQRS